MRIHKSLFSVLFVLFVSYGFTLGKDCSIGDVPIACPKNFTQIESDLESIRIFKQSGKGSGLYFFMSVGASLDNEKLAKHVLVDLSSRVEQFHWKSVVNPLSMQTKTKYKFDLIASMGLTTSHLFEIKKYVFTVNEKKLILGYVSDWSEDRTTNQRRFSAGEGFGDNAAGCNAVVTALNSVTKEFEDETQRCSFSSFAS